MKEWMYGYTFFLDLSTSWRWVVSYTLWPLCPSKRALGTHCIGVWVGPRVGMDDVEKRKFLTLPWLELRPLGRSGRSQWQYRLSYPSYASVSPRLGHDLFLPDPFLSINPILNCPVIKRYAVHTHWQWHEATYKNIPSRCALQTAHLQCSCVHQLWTINRTLWSFVELPPSSGIWKCNI
jgi:hypothetical protein